MREAAETRSYAAALSVLVVAEWLYLDWASRAPKPLPDNFVYAEWITLHDNPDFCDFVDFLRAELDRIGPRHFGHHRPLRCSRHRRRTWRNGRERQGRRA